MKFNKTKITDLIVDFRSELYNQFTAPIDAMWEQLYIASSQHYLIGFEGNNIGYCCIDDNNCLLQIFLVDDNKYMMDRIVGKLIEEKLIHSASLSAIEPLSFNACLFHSKSIKTNSFCFQYLKKPADYKTTLNLLTVTTKDIPSIKKFLKQQIGFEDKFGYTENLVERKEIYILMAKDIIMATSECRFSDSQTDVADLGVIVNKDFQKKGLATQILSQQAEKSLMVNRRPICSTTYDNIASRKAIEKAGFYCSNIIFDISF